jgi:methionine synthase II (cobalamin-independent)
VRSAAAATDAARAIALERLAALTTTGVGSLPFSDPAAAVRHVARGYDLPFCPQLPRLEGDMVREWLGGDPGRCGWSPDRDRERPAAWETFTDAMAEAPPPHGLVKLQVTGPATLAAALEGPGRHELAVEIARWLAANASGQLRRLDELGLSAVLVVDEPGLAGSRIADPRVYDPLRTTGAAAWGLHVCGEVPWELVDALEVDLLSFDAILHDADAPALDRILDRGGRIAWGVLDADAGDGSAAVAARLRAALRSLEHNPELVAHRSIVTPTCGTGLLSPRQEARAARVLGDTTRRMRAQSF